MHRLFQSALDQMMVVCDDVALPIGTTRHAEQRKQRRAQWIEKHRSAFEYPALCAAEDRGRRSWARRARQIMSSANLLKKRARRFEEMTEKAIEVLELWIAAGIAMAMQDR